MTGKEIIKAMMKASNVNQKMLAERVGKGGQPGVSKTLNTERMPLSFLVKCAEAMGYEIVIRPRKRGRKEEGVYTLGVEEED